VKQCGGTEEREVDAGCRAENGERHVKIASVVEPEREQDVEEGGDGEGNEIGDHAVEADPTPTVTVAVLPDDENGESDIDKSETEAPTGIQ